MDPTSSPPVLARWDLPGDAVFADHMARVALRRQRATAFGSTRPWIIYTAMVVVLGVVVVNMPFVVSIWLVALGVLFAWAIIGSPRRLARALRALPTAHEPYTVTLDVEGYHVVGQSFADHLRWRVFQDAAIDEGFLVMRRRGSKVQQLVPLETLDPGMDREWMAREVGRLIAADGVHVTSER